MVIATSRMETNRGSTRNPALAAACAAILGCSGAGGGASSTAPSDAGRARDSLATADAASNDANAACGDVPPSGKQLVATTDPVSVLGLTKDGYAIYFDTNSLSLDAVPMKGGAMRSIGSNTSQSGTVWINGTSVLFLPTPANPNTGIAPLSAWSATSGAHTISASAFAYDSYYYTYDIDPTAAHVAYLASTDGLSATLTVSSIDGKTQTPLVDHIDLTNQACPPILQFSGETLLTSYCLSAGFSDAGGLEAIATFAGPSFAQVTLGTVTPNGGPVASVNPQNTAILVSSSPGLIVYPLTGGAATTVDAAGSAGLFTTTGDIVYTTMDGALKRYSMTSATMTPLVASKMNYLLALSPDDQWAQVAEQMDLNTGLSDLYLASATTAGSATSSWGKPTAAPMGFSSDSAFSTFGLNFPTTFGALPFDVEASPVAGGSPSEASQSLSQPLFTSGSHLIVNDHVTRLTGAADIESLDLAASSERKTLVTQAAPNYIWAPPDQLVYSWNCRSDSASGVWVISTP
jgi:VCBS repeat-containing protein